MPISLFFTYVVSHLFRQPLRIYIYIYILHVYDIAFNYTVGLISERPPWNLQYVQANVNAVKSYQNEMLMKA